VFLLKHFDDPQEIFGMVLEVSVVNHCDVTGRVRQSGPNRLPFPAIG
jgi:hypothetical protein